MPSGPQRASRCTCSGILDIEHHAARPAAGAAVPSTAFSGFRTAVRTQSDGPVPLYRLQ